MFKFSYTTQTDIGTSHLVNEDSLGIVNAGQCFVLADGVGGAQQGDVASKFAVSCMLKLQQELLIKHKNSTHEEVEQALREALNQVNDRLCQIAQGQGITMGTTIVAGLFHRQTLHYVHLGDSRLYLLRHGLLMQMTLDDSLKAQLLAVYPRREEYIEASVPNNIITQALGITEQPIINYARCDIRTDDTVFCSSDGLHDSVPFGLIEERLRHSKSLELNAKKLIAMAIAQGSHDNISVLLIKVMPSLFTRILTALTDFKCKS